MLAAGCPEFEYDHIPGADAVLKRAMVEFFQALRTASYEQKLAHAKETRIWQSRYFHTLTPAGHPYYAGHYRGEDFFCLRDYSVQIDSDPLVGSKPAVVPFIMVQLSDKLHRAAALLDLEMHRHPNPRVSPTYLAKLIQVLAFFFATFLTIHPYANGNGHMARTIVILLLDRYDIRAPRFSIHPRPQDPLYADAIYRYRRREPKPLEMLLLRSLA
jgi:Fic family protein